MRIISNCALCALTFALLFAPPALANVRPHSLFTDNAVLQQGVEMPVWGTAGDGEKVTVRIQGQEASTVARGRRWMVRLKPLKAGGPYPMTISGGNTIELKNIMVGEVWVCSGQSNMQFNLGSAANAEAACASATDPLLRLNWVQPCRPSNVRLHDVTGAWCECTPKTAYGFSAVGYYFGRDLRKALKVPVGLLFSAVGGTSAEAWTSRLALRDNPDLRKVVSGPPPTDQYDPAFGFIRNAPGGLYNGTIAPLQPFPIRGVIWCQGEFDVPRAFEYQNMFTTLIKNWRDDWKQPNMPFLFVQLSPYNNAEPNPEGCSLAELREAQRLTSLSVPNTAMAVITDCGDEKTGSIHPPNKEPVGARLALAARAIAYKEKIIYQGPMYRSAKVQGDKVAISFANIGGGLVANGGELKGFTIAGEDRKFVPAKAEIVGETVVVSSADLPRPVAVRFGWTPFPKVNLFNKEGLPASPFRTDNFPLTTKPQSAK